MGYASRPLSKQQREANARIIQVPHCLGEEWLGWFRWHARLAGTGAILGPSRGMPEIGPRVVECLPAAPALAGSPRTLQRGGDGTGFPEMPLVGPPDGASISPSPNPGIVSGGWRPRRPSPMEKERW